MSDLALVPVTLAEANAFVGRHHRHHRPVPGHKFSVGVVKADQLAGVAVVGRPVARSYNDGRTLEVTRVATDGTPNVNSMLYGAVSRATFALGYSRLITYTRKDETGASLRAAGWRVLAERKARSWSRDNVARGRSDATEPYQRLLWEAVP